MKKTLSETGWNLDNSYAHLPKSLFTTLDPTPVSSPKLIKFNHTLAASLGLIAHALTGEKGITTLAGNIVPEGATPLAQAYAGHQFGNFTMLGDGRAHLIGEQITPRGERFDIQLKGSGRTPYSRQGDGRASLGPMLREYIISEAMYALGIPTTRSLAVVTTGEPVLRESTETGAILTRVAKSHIRVGTFEYISQWGNLEELRALADYTIERHCPDAGNSNSNGNGNGNGSSSSSSNSNSNSNNPYLFLLEDVIKKQAALIAKWQLVGFIHGVMNTDNMTLSGETIDYGPCAFMDTYDPATVFSSIDYGGRYAYGSQPRIALWNISRFAETLLPLLHEDEAQAIILARDALQKFSRVYHCNWMAGMRAKLGIFNEEEEDETLIRTLLSLMEKYRADFTNTFRSLTLDEMNEDKIFSSEEFAQWHKLWQARSGRQQESKKSIRHLMKSSNPAVIPRNHRVEEALQAAHEDIAVMERLLDVLARPFAHSPEDGDYYTQPAKSDKPYRTFCGT